MASRNYIPRGCRTNHIPGLSEESKSMHEEYKTQYASDPFDNGTIEIYEQHERIEEEEMGGGHYINQHDPQQS